MSYIEHKLFAISLRHKLFDRLTERFKTAGINAKVMTGWGGNSRGIEREDMFQVLSPGNGLPPIAYAFPCHAKIALNPEAGPYEEPYRTVLNTRLGEEFQELEDKVMRHVCALLESDRLHKRA